MQGNNNTEISQMQNMSGVGTPCTNSKKSGFLGLFGYPYGYYRYGYGYGYPYGGYYGYHRGSYPYRWSRWWYNNGYGEKDGPGEKEIVFHSKHENERRLETPGIVTKEEAQIAAKWFAEDDINVYAFIAGKDATSKFQTWWYALQEESAIHGSLGKSEKTNVTKDDLFTTSKIAFAHFKERSDYYHRLYEFVNRSQSANHRRPGSIQTQLPATQEKNVGMRGLPSRRQPQTQSHQYQGTVYYYYSETPEKHAYDIDYHY